MRINKLLVSLAFSMLFGSEAAVLAQSRRVKCPEIYAE